MSELTKETDLLPDIQHEIAVVDAKEYFGEGTDNLREIDAFYRGHEKGFEAGSRTPPQPAWHPILSEADLPRAMGWYLVTLDTGDSNREFDVKECLYQSHGVWAGASNYPVIAWREKPQPYQRAGGRDDE